MSRRLILEVKTDHAAQLTGDPDLYVPAGCASTSLYRRRTDQEGGWEPVWLGRTDYLAYGSERDWQFGMPESASLLGGKVVDRESIMNGVTSTDATSSIS